MYYGWALMPLAYLPLAFCFISRLLKLGFVAVFMELASTNHLPGPWAAKNWPVFTTQSDKEEFENVLNVYGSLKKKLFDSPAMGQ